MFEGYTEASYQEATHIGFKGTGRTEEIDDRSRNMVSLGDGFTLGERDRAIIGAVLLKPAPKPERVEFIGEVIFGTFHGCDVEMIVAPSGTLNKQFRCVEVTE